MATEFTFYNAAYRDTAGNSVSILYGNEMGTGTVVVGVASLEGSVVAPPNADFVSILTDVDCRIAMGENPIARNIAPISRLLKATIVPYVFAVNPGWKIAAIEAVASGGGGGGAGQVTAVQASRFLDQAGLSSTPAEVQTVATLGFGPWITAQIAMPRATTLWDRLVTKGFRNANFITNQSGFDGAVWHSLLTGTDQLRQSAALAYLNFLVVSIDTSAVRWQQFQQAHYMDILHDGAFGNFRPLIEAITRNKTMSAWLTFSGSKKSNAGVGQPDENYAREIMQLFTIGLLELNLDGSKKLNAGQPIPTYSLDTVKQIAKLFTGYVYDTNDIILNPDAIRTPLNSATANLFNPADHDLSQKQFLGVTIAALGGSPTDAQIRTYANTSLMTLFDTLFNHLNTAPFVAMHMIRNLVTSNPSAAYIGRVSAVFVNNGAAVRGDMGAVIRAVLMDVEARDDAAALASNTFGRLSEPSRRYVKMARLLGTNSPNDEWNMLFANRFGQQIGRSPSVFNWFLANYVPSATELAAGGLIAPTFQITNEVTIVNFINQMFVLIRDGSPKYDPTNGAFLGIDLQINFNTLTPFEPITDTLLAHLNRYLAADRIPAGAIAVMKTGVDSITAPWTNSNPEAVVPVLSVAQQRILLAVIFVVSSIHTVEQK